MTTTIARSVYASVAHRYWRPDWTPEKNREVYASDASSEGLGANMRLELKAEAGRKSEGELTQTLSELKERLDHQCLFSPQHELAEKPSTLERIALFLASKIDLSQWQALTVWESEHLGCEVTGNSLKILLKQRNLTLEIAGQCDEQSGLAVSREAVRAAVEALLVKLNGINDPDVQLWGKKLFANLRAAVPGLTSLRVDLGRHEGIVVHSDT